ncbi:MAG TPA: hypothetical protein VFI90_20490 [Rubrobacter sp.]|nr:hypothetical protein [Rubrobacter sp.]
MNYMEFNPYFVGERNEVIRREVSTYRLQKRLRQERTKAKGSWLVTFASKSTQPLLRKVGLAG